MKNAPFTRLTTTRSTAAADRGDGTRLIGLAVGAALASAALAALVLALGGGLLLALVAYMLGASLLLAMAVGLLMLHAAMTSGPTGRPGLPLGGRMRRAAS